MAGIASTLLVAALALLPALTLAEEAIVVIVHPERDARLALDGVREIYLKQRTLWDDGAGITAINRDAGTEVRERFSRRILGRSSRALAAYWNERYIEGVFPPTTLASDEAVRRYVATHENAIGYLPASTADDSVRVILRLE